MRKIILLIFCFFMVGCSTGPKMYYFGNYSETLYQHEKNQTDATLANHKEELQRVIDKSKRINLPVPPGIYAELGYIKLKENRKEEAIVLFTSEAAIYPESKYFMDRLILLARKNDKKENQNSAIIKDQKEKLNQQGEKIE